MGESGKQGFQLSFNRFLRVGFQGSRVTSNGGLILVRELDERMGFSELIDEHLTDSRANNARFSFADLLRSAGQARAVLLAAAGRGVSEPVAVRRHAATDLGAACAGWVALIG